MRPLECKRILNCECHAAASVAIQVQVAQVARISLQALSIQHTAQTGAQTAMLQEFAFMSALMLSCPALCTS